MSLVAASARKMRHCCSVRPCARNDGRKWRITDSRARSNDIGKEREKSRIGTRRVGASLLPGGFLGIVHHSPRSEIDHPNQSRCTAARTESGKIRIAIFI